MKNLPPPKPDQMGDATGEAPIVNIANALTLLRLLLVPVFVVLMLAHGGHPLAWRSRWPVSPMSSTGTSPATAAS